MRASADAVGLFALASAGVATVVQFLDGVSSQRVTQARAGLVALNPENEGSVNFINTGRLLMLIGVATVVSAVWLLFDIEVGLSVGALLVGQGAYAFAVSTRIYSASPKSLVFLQLFNFAVFCVTASAVFFTSVLMSAASLLLVSGVSSFCAAMPFLARDLMERRKLRHTFRHEFTLLYTSSSWRHLGGLVAYQGVNALGGATDTLLTSIGGLRTAAEYQIIRRPMLALSSLNVALGQSAINRYSRGDTSGWQRSLLRLLPIVVVWPTLGIIGLLLVRKITPLEYDISMLAGGLLALSFAVGAFLQVSGTLVLVRMQSMGLFVAVVARIAVLIIMAMITVPSLGVVGIGLSLVVANVVLLGIHLALLLSGDRTAWRKLTPVSTSI